MPGALDALAAAGPREVIHLEPCAELLRPAGSVADLADWLHGAAADYQRTLLIELRRRERDGRLAILEVTRLGYSPRATNGPTLIRWRPTL